MINLWQSEGRQIVFPTAPQAFNPLWEGVKAELIEVRALRFRLGLFTGVL